jgi:hypothetical protein
VPGISGEWLPGVGDNINTMHIFTMAIGPGTPTGS